MENALDEIRMYTVFFLRGISQLAVKSRAEAGSPKLTKLRSHTLELRLPEQQELGESCKKRTTEGTAYKRQENKKHSRAWTTLIYILTS